MLLKYSQYQKRSRLASNGQPQRPTGMKMLNGKGKGYRKGVKCAASKRLAPRLIASKKEEMTMSMDVCDNSNDSGLGFDHLDFSTTRTAYIEQEYWGNEESAKKRRYDVKLESDNANDNFTFLQTRVAQQQNSELPLCLRGKGGMGASGKGGGKGAKVVVASTQGLSRDGKVQLQILSQPEVQHRARYQTEGSRGAVKDRAGNSFPIVKLCGYNKPTTLEVYIGTDQGRVAPHMFYQACRVSGKNSTPCVEKKVDGTVLIEIEMDPAKDMTVTCDCVGILKERNVDVEHRFPDESTGRSKKKSTRCRMVFRTVITNEDGSLETLQVTSQPIICTQPPGVPEICKKSLSACPATGGLELFILGKNFLKDTRVCFSQGEPGSDLYWESVVQPDKEFLQQSHLVCTVPPYRDEGIREMVAVQLSVRSSGRSSEPHTFYYTSINALPMDPSTASRASAQNLISSPVFPAQNVLVGVPWHVPIPPSPTFIQEEAPKIDDKVESEMMPPPSTVPPVRRSPTGASSEVKREAESPPCLAAALREFVTPDATLPSIAVEKYLSRIESPPQVQQPAVQVPNTVPVSKSELISLPMPQLSLEAQQALPSLPSTPTVIMEPKIEGLLSEGTQPLLNPNELLYPVPASQVSPATVNPVLLETTAPVPVQEFVSSQSSSQQTRSFDVGSLSAHATTTMVYSTDNLAVTTAASMPQAFPPLLPEPTSLSPFVSPTKTVDNKVVKAEFHGSILPSLDATCTPKVPTLVQKKCEEGIPLPQELTQMSENDLLSYINPSCFDQV